MLVVDESTDNLCVLIDREKREMHVCWFGETQPHSVALAELLPKFGSVYETDARYDESKDMKLVVYAYEEKESIDYSQFRTV